MKVKWVSVFESIDEAMEYFEGQNIKPTLRTLFYRLVSQQRLPNTKSYYRSLSSKLVKARKQGRYPWDCISDTIRTTFGGMYDYFPNGGQVEKIKSILVHKLDELDLNVLLDGHFRRFPRDLVNFTVNRWAMQPEGCVIWIEKAALASTIQAWVKHLEVPVSVNRGYNSWTNIYKQVQFIKRILNRSGHERVIILYLGDLDPSGVDMDRHLKEALAFFGLDQGQIDFRRLALTEEQVEQYGLPPKPGDADTLEKLTRDLRMKKYDRKYIVELDALLAYAPDDFKKEVGGAVDSVWDEGIYTELKEVAEDLDDDVEDAIAEAVEDAKKRLK